MDITENAMKIPSKRLSEVPFPTIIALKVYAINGERLNNNKNNLARYFILKAPAVKINGIHSRCQSKMASQKNYSIGVVFVLAIIVVPEFNTANEKMLVDLSLATIRLG
ncbi:MAG: hypothetical protein ACRKGH_00590 [Dehalogenimonas sp.]